MGNKHIGQIILLFSLLLYHKAQAQTLSFICDNKKKLDIPRLSPIPHDSTMIRLLNGAWKFSPDISTTPCKPAIEVPGEWVMQGFKVATGRWAGYERTFAIAPQWNDRRIKLRFDAVFSEADIWINGKHAGHHLGGFTPFELDITALVNRKAENTLLVKVKSETIADSLSSASKYAVHPLGGISRKVFLMALPDVHLSYLHTNTEFDQHFDNAQLVVNTVISNESNSSTQKASITFELFRDEMQTQKVFGKTVAYNEKLTAGGYLQKKETFPVPHPDKWDPEHPNLYWLKLTLHAAEGREESVVRAVGFRQIAVRGNRVFVNDRPIKLRGINRHEVMPLRGRSLTPDQWAEDVKLFREANINYIRTSHYPPAPEFIEACNRLGMFVEMEAPFCWAELTVVPPSLYYQALVQPMLEMVNTFKSDPAVLIWSIGNESRKYKEYFSKTAAMVKEFDPLRPRNFSQYDPPGDDEELEIGNQHYPRGMEGITQNRNAKRPIIFDEYCHLNAYNRLEFYTDPAVCYLWGKGLSSMWEAMNSTPAILGGAIWAGIDDTFVLPDGQVVGYGVWGIIDGWRRKKPEFWEVKKVYSPVKATQSGNYDPSTRTLHLTVRNRFLFTDLKECRFEWEAAGEKGNLQLSAAAGDSASSVIKLRNNPGPGTTLSLNIFDARNVAVDAYQFTLLPVFTDNSASYHQKESLRYEESSEQITVQAGKTLITIRKPDGDILHIQYEGRELMAGSARLMILPMNGEGFGVQMTGERKEWPVFTSGCSNRVVRSTALERNAAYAELKVYDSYTEADGFTTYRLEQDGSLRVSYRYALKKAVNPQQWGLIFSLPPSFQQLEWVRNGQWNAYPNDNIGRLRGKARARSAFPDSGPAGPRTRPDWPWSADQNTLGTSDFRSTKQHVTDAVLTDGVNGFGVDGRGFVDIRSWLDTSHVKVLLASYTGLGAESFFRMHANEFDHPLHTGEVISDTFHIRFAPYVPGKDQKE